MLQDRLVAHRGFQKHYPENSLLAHQKALEAGAHYIETDILFSADQQPVLYHDMMMLRVSAVESFIHAHTLEELVQQPAYEPDRLGEEFRQNTITPLTDLVALLQQHPEATAFIEIKRSGIAIIGIETAFEIVTRALEPVKAQCIIISFNDEFIAHAHKQGYPRLGLVLKKWEELGASTITGINPEFIFCDTGKIPANATLDTIESTTVIYEVEDPEQAIHWFQRGADMVETFDIGGMIENLSHRAL